MPTRNAPRKPHVDEPADAYDHRGLLHKATWADYQRLCQLRGERAVPRLTFDRDVLEIVSPSNNHEEYKSTIGSLLEVYCLEAVSGRKLWEFRTNSGVTGVPSSFAVDGVQYIAVQSGWGVDAQKMVARLDQSHGTTTFVPQGGVVWVFALQD